MKKTITIYELLGKVKYNKDTNIYVKYINRMTEKEDTMWACVENIIYKLDNKVIYLNDEVEIIEEPKKIEPFTKEEMEIYHDMSAPIDDLVHKVSLIIDYINKEK